MLSLRAQRNDLYAAGSDSGDRPMTDWKSRSRIGRPAYCRFISQLHAESRGLLRGIALPVASVAGGTLSDREQTLKCGSRNGQRRLLAATAPQGTRATGLLAKPAKLSSPAPNSQKAAGSGTAEKPRMRLVPEPPEPIA